MWSCRGQGTKEKVKEMPPLRRQKLIGTDATTSILRIQLPTTR